MRAAASSIGIRYVRNHRFYVRSKPSSASLIDGRHFLPASRSRRRRPGTARLSRKLKFPLKVRGHHRHVAGSENQTVAHLLGVAARRTPSVRAADGRVPARFGIIKLLSGRAVGHSTLAKSRSKRTCKRFPKLLLVEPRKRTKKLFRPKIFDG